MFSVLPRRQGQPCLGWSRVARPAAPSAVSIAWCCYRGQRVLSLVPGKGGVEDVRLLASRDLYAAHEGAGDSLLCRLCGLRAGYLFPGGSGWDARPGTRKRAGTLSAETLA